MLKMETITAPVDWKALMDRPRLYADLMKSDLYPAAGTRNVILTTLGTKRDMEDYGIEFRPGEVVDFWNDDADDEGNPDPLFFSGPVFYNEAKGYWYASIEDAEIRHASETKHMPEI